MGGEKFLPLFTSKTSLGSPPHGRGKVISPSAKSACNGITPAWAGKSTIIVISRAWNEDHPRMGGEKLFRFHHQRKCSGSPPHGRGKVVYLSVSIFLARITPAWAGKSPMIHTIRIYTWDHPRMGGEKHHIRADGCKDRGSPPHGRGKVLQDLCDTYALGITPAWAGKSSLLWFLLHGYKDHPRMGGEKAKG